MMRGERARAFWAWFAEHVREIEAASAGDAALAELDIRVESLGRFDWEIGPGLVAENALVISPCGDVERLEETEELVRQAPSVAGWEFHSSTPPKQWTRPAFQLEANELGTIDVDASKWRYALVQYPDGFREIEIAMPELSAHPEWLKVTAAEIVLDGLLGEARRIREFDAVTPVGALSADTNGRSRLITEIGTGLEG